MRDHHLGMLFVRTIFGVFVMVPLCFAGADQPNAGRVVLELKGYVVPASQVTVSPKVGGQVVEMAIEEGKQVKAGDVLARLDSAEFDGAFRLARAELKLAKAELGKTKEGGSRTDLSIAQAKVDVAQARVHLAQYRLDCTVVRAPIDGTVLEKFAEVGTMIDPKALNMKGSLCLLADLRTIEVELSVQERELAKVAKGQPCLIRLEAYPQVAYHGCVNRLLPVADRAKGAVGVRVRLEVPAGDDRLRPELGAIVQILDKNEAR
jgi:RND family efflux transporter MFP subunit